MSILTFNEKLAIETQIDTARHYANTTAGNCHVVSILI